MSMVSTGAAPTASNQVPQGQAKGDATGSGSAGDGGFAGLVAALVAGAEPDATATSGEQVVPGTVPDADAEPAAPADGASEPAVAPAVVLEGQPALDPAVQLALEALVVPAVATTATTTTGPTGTPSTGTSGSTAGSALAASAQVPADATADAATAPTTATSTMSTPGAAGSGLAGGGPGGAGDQPADGRAPASQLPGTPAVTGAAGTAPGETTVATRGLGSLGAAVARITDAGAATPAAEPAAVTGLGAAAPVTTAAPVVAPVAPPAPAATAAQLVPAVFAVHRRGGEGEHHLTLDITPEDLGPVRMTVALRDGQVHMLLAGSSELSREALRAALPELRKLVEAAGIVAGSFDVQPDNAGTGRGGTELGRSPADTDRGNGAPANPSDRAGSPDNEPGKAAPALARSGSSRRSLDLHL